MRYVVIFLLYLGGALSAHAQVSFAASWGPFRVISELQCLDAICTPSARLEKINSHSPSSPPLCVSRIERFPSGTILSARWVEVHGNPVLLLSVARTELGPTVQYVFHPELDCTYTASWLPQAES